MRECECHRERECLSCQIGRMDDGARRDAKFTAPSLSAFPLRARAATGRLHATSSPSGGTVLTLRDPSTSVLDLCLDWNILFNTQHDRHRFSHARERVRKLLLDNDRRQPCLAHWVR
jgi:hypothetical protein